MVCNLTVDEFREMQRLKKLSYLQREFSGTRQATATAVTSRALLHTGGPSRATGSTI